LAEFSYQTPGKPPALNSCMQADIPATSKCGGKGFCKSFSTSSIAAQQSTPLAFCQCETNWADPECGTRRKSQMKAFFWSTFLGFTGADYFYLGYPLWGVGKLCTLGGCGFWWLLDIVRTGAGPVYAYDFRTANDLPHWVAVLIMISLGMLLGFLFAIQNYLSYRRQKRLETAAFLNKEEARTWKNANTEEELKSIEGPRFRPNSKPPFEGRPGFCGYGSTLPVPLPSAVTYASVGPFGPAGIPGQGSPTPPAMGMAAPTHYGILFREGTEIREGANMNELNAVIAPK